MTKIISYNSTISNQFAKIARITSTELWITSHGILSDAGLRDHFGRDAVKEALQIAIKCDHLRYDNGNNSAIIVDTIGREGLNLAVHPFSFNCFIHTMWRFSGDELVRTFQEYGDAGMFLGWLENLGRDVSERDGQPYERPSNMFGNKVYLDH